MSSNQKQTWQAILEHYLFAKDYDPAAHISYESKGILGPRSSSSEELIHKWLAAQIR